MGSRRKANQPRQASPSSDLSMLTAMPAGGVGLPGLSQHVRDQTEGQLEGITMCFTNYKRLRSFPSHRHSFLPKHKLLILNQQILFTIFPRIFCPSKCSLSSPLPSPSSHRWYRLSRQLRTAAPIPSLHASSTPPMAASSAIRPVWRSLAAATGPPVVIVGVLPSVRFDTARCSVLSFSN